MRGDRPREQCCAAPKPLTRATQHCAGETRCAGDRLQPASLTLLNVYHMFHIMPDNIENVMLEILKRLQSDMAGLKADVSTLTVDVADVKARMTRVEDLVTKQRRDTAGMLVMMKGTAGVFDQRLIAVETDMVMLKDRL
jgi:hypothetical protein